MPCISCNGWYKCGFEPECPPAGVLLKGDPEVDIGGTKVDIPKGYTKVGVVPVCVDVEVYMHEDCARKCDVIIRAAS